MKRSHTEVDHEPHDTGACDCQVCTRTRRKGAPLATRRSKKHWFDDGTVVVRIERTHYRMYKGQLIRQSEFFRKLFEDSAGDDKETHAAKQRPLIDGHVVYEVNHPDATSADFEALLECIDNGLSYAFTRPSTLEAAAIIRAASALSFPAVLTFAKRVMEELWQFNMDDLSIEPLAHAAMIAQLAKTYGLSPAIRKRALYEILCQEDYAQAEPWFQCNPRSPEELRIAGHSRLALQRVTSNVTTLVLAGGAPTSVFLPRSDIIHLVIARGRIQAEWYSLTASHPRISDLCQKSANGCAAPFEFSLHWDKRVKGYEILKVGLIDPLRAIGEIRGIGWKELGYCDSCIEGITKWCDDAGTKLWNLIDRILSEPYVESNHDAVGDSV